MRKIWNMNNTIYITMIYYPEGFEIDQIYWDIKKARSRKKELKQLYPKLDVWFEKRKINVI